MRKIGKYLIPSLAAVLTVGLALFAWSRFARRPAALNAPPQKIRVANIGLYSNFNVIADKNGYFRQNGLDAAVEEYDAGNTSMDALLSGRADVAVAADFVGVSNMFAHPDLVILAEAGDHEVWNVLARKDRGIKTPADLKGRKIGVTRKTAGEFFLGEFLTANGLKLGDVKVDDLSATDMVDQFGRGDLDAIVTFQPHAYDLQKAMGDKVLVLSTQEKRRTIALIYALRPFVEAHPDAVERYLRALVQAEDFERAHPAESKALLAKALSYDAAYMDFIWPKFDFVIQLDQDLLYDLESQARWIIAEKLTDRTEVPNYLEAIWFDGLEKVKPRSVTIIH